MRAVGDDDDVVEVLAIGDAGEELDLLLGVDGVGFGDDVVEGDAVGEEVVASDAAFGLAGVLVAATAEGDDDGRDVLVVERDCLVEAGVEDGRGATGVFGCAEDGDGVGGLGVVDVGGGDDLVMQPGEPAGDGEQDEQDQPAHDVQASCVGETCALSPVAHADAQVCRECVREIQLVLEGERDFVGGDGAFAEDHPGVAAAGEVDDGGGDGAGGGAAVHDERELVAELVTDAVGGGALGQAGEVGGGCGDGQAQLGGHGAADVGFRHADGDVAGVSSDAQGELAAGADDKREGAGPEALGEAVESGVEVAGELVGVRGVGEQERERLVARAGLELVDAIDGAEVYGVDGETVEGVGGQGCDLAVVEAVNDVGDEVGFGLVRMDAEHFGDQGRRGPLRH